MNCDTTDHVDGIDRRSVLAAAGAGLSFSLSGCVDTVQSVVSDAEDDQISLSLVTVPDDGNRETVRIARHLEQNLEAVGIDVTIAWRSRSEFLKMVLIDHDFDLYVGRHPADFDPDFLYEALHSTYAEESGWQNPFQYSNPTFFDPLLEEQRRADGDERRERIKPVLRALAEEKPFDPICRPDEYRVANTRFDGWGDGHLATRRGYLGLESEADAERLHALVTDARPSQNVNPLSATVDEQGTITDLLYDSLGTLVVTEDDEGVAYDVEPWLAAEPWEWEPTDEIDASESVAETDETKTDADGMLTATVTLREDCTFHDGEPVTAEDVAFTYQFLKDTARGQSASPSPAPRYRGQVSAVENIEVEDDYRLRITVDAGTEVGERALTVPILPRHIWWNEIQDRIGDLENFRAPQGRWGLVETNSVSPIGSGPFQFESQSERTYLHLERFDDHFSRRDDVDLPEPTVDELRFTVDPGSTSSISRVESGDADVTSSLLEAHSISDIPDSSDVERLESPSWTFYHLGFNTDSGPCSKTSFRQAVTQLIDKERITEKMFYGHATPLSSPVTDEWVPDDLAWDGDDPVTPFIGTDGSLNVAAARAAFEAAGFRYDDDGRLRDRY
ncbi:ABC transporter substrate-binding protein [Natronorubrum thiooxidans]|uniref:Peptide/nickel transport system substrate-binding protein n=1 Tax=Natronorubrum thiooxidans TaxID=308853 RepID=A0A1N7D770_9EURY|nr:ABC transporter substrate-binding protein [Natronorubrum thiooxidans]SIR71661.1 peptide/nickel transport system substrate-binding protein [Natronorubrum thiooxidans]